MKRKPVSYYPSREAEFCLAKLKAEEERPRTQVIDMAVRGWCRIYEEDPNKARELAMRMKQ